MMRRLAGGAAMGRCVLGGGVLVGWGGGRGGAETFDYKSCLNWRGTDFVAVVGALGDGSLCPDYLGRGEGSRG